MEGAYNTALSLVKKLFEQTAWEKSELNTTVFHFDEYCSDKPELEI